jgi:uridine phosphorylase
MNSEKQDEPVMTARELLEYRRKAGLLPAEGLSPQALILAPQKSLAAYAIRRQPVRKIPGFLGEFYLFKRTGGRVALSTGFGIGAPVVAGLADEFAALGVKTMVLVGMAGGLSPELEAGALVLPTRALRGEGVSAHYVPPSPSIDASAELVDTLRASFQSHGHAPTLGPVWTTDAPFRELRSVVLEHQRAGIVAVDMEAAALLAVAQASGIRAAVVFSIADRLSDGHWRMDADFRPAQAGLQRAFDVVFEVLSSRTHA